MLSLSWQSLLRRLFDARRRDDEDPIIVVGFGYPSLFIEISRYRPELFQIRDTCPPHHGVPGNVRPGPTESFHGGRLQNPPRFLPGHPGFALDSLLPSGSGRARRQSSDALPIRYIDRVSHRASREPLSPLRRFREKHTRPTPYLQFTPPFLQYKVNHARPVGPQEA
jgi:hypothetical protein